MKRLHFGLAFASALLLTSCLNKSGDGPIGPSIPPRSLLSGKVQERTITLQDASGKAQSQITEKLGERGELLQRDSSEMSGTTPTLRLSKVYSRDKDGYLTTIATRSITTAGEKKSEERFTYKPYGTGVNLLTAQTTYDSENKKISEITYTYLGLRPESSVETTFPNPTTGQVDKRVIYTQYRQDGVFEVARSYELVPGAKASDPARPRYTQEEWLRRDIYGRPIQREVLFYDTTVDPGKQNLEKPIRLELTVTRYTAYGDEEIHSHSIYTPKKSETPSKPTPLAGKSLPVEASGDGIMPVAQRQPYLELSDLLVYEYRYGSPDKNGFPTRCEVTETRGLKKVKTTTTRTITYRLFPEKKGK